jgi:hypothetical protein
MTPGPKGQKRVADVIGNAVHVMRVATGEIVEAPRGPNKSGWRHRMTSSVYAVLVPKIAIPDLESLRKKACELAREYGLSPSQYWYARRGEDIAFCFRNRFVADLFEACCKTNDIPYRTE